MAAIELNDYEKAEKELSYAADMLDGSQHYMYMINLGLLKIRQDELNKAISILKSVIADLRKESDSPPFADEMRRAHLNLSLALLRSEDYDAAQNAASESLELALRLRHREGEINARNNLGIALYLCGDEEEGRDSLRAALEMAESYYGISHAKTTGIRETLKRSNKH